MLVSGATPSSLRRFRRNTWASTSTDRLDAGRDGEPVRAAGARAVEERVDDTLLAPGAGRSSQNSVKRGKLLARRLDGVDREPARRQPQTLSRPTARK